MLVASPAEDKYDAVSDFNSIASEFGDVQANAKFPDHVENLVNLRNVLIARRRIFAQDAAAYPVVAVGRSEDIIAISHMIGELDRIIEHEKHLQATAM